MQAWQTDHAEANRFLPNAVGLIQLAFPDCGEVTSTELDERDTKEATDLVTASGLCIGWRNRYDSPKRDRQYRDLTIRYRRPTGTPTEIHKVLDGYSSHYVYTFVGLPPLPSDRFCEWAVFDMDRFRTLWPELEPWGDVRENVDRSSHLIGWPIEELADRPGLVLRWGGIRLTT